MRPGKADARSAWTVADLNADQSWIVCLDQAETGPLAGAMRAAHVPGKALFDYTAADLDPGRAWKPIARCLKEIKEGRGFAVLRGLPRDSLTAEQFELLTWCIGLHIGVARPQGKNSQYLSAV